MNDKPLQMSNRLWQAAHRLAAELAQRDVDNNLLRTAVSYMKDHPTADLHDWLYRLAQLGDLFSSSEQTGRYRHELYEACKRLDPQPTSGAEWVLVLSWATRLFNYYETNPAEARQVSNVGRLQLPPAPPVFKPPRVPAKKPQPKPKPVPPERSKPESNLAAEFMAFFQKKQAQDDDV